MLNKLLYKEFRLALHPTIVLFWLLSAMLMIPAYPYLVITFYTMLGIFFVCLTGRENNDLTYTLMLPVRKRDVVRARISLAVISQLVQLLIAAAVAVVRAAVLAGSNPAGLDANVAFFGFALLIYGVFNAVFFPAYFQNPDNVGRVFCITCVVIWPCILVAEATAFAVPFVRDVLDTPDPLYMPQKLMALAIGALLYAGLTWVASKKASAAFEKHDL